MASPEPFVIIAIAVPAIVLIAFAASYNRFIRQRNLIRDSWANVDTELRRRYDLIPNLVETVKGYAAHERGILEHVTASRSAAVRETGTPAKQAAVERELVGSMRQLMFVAENYPELRASENYLELQRELANTEDRIQAARRFFNNNVRDFNRRVQAFPSMIIARMFGFFEAEYFEVEPAVRAAPPAVELG